MASILVLNAGSTSLRYKLFDKDSFKVLKKGCFQDLPDDMHAYQQAFRDVLRQIGNLTEIRVVGHRIVHGGTEFRKPTLLDEEVLKAIGKYNHLDPLHNPANLTVARSAKMYLPDIPHLACFDTSFYVDLPPVAKIYAIPLEYYKKYGIQRFGFHGISHQYAAVQAAKILKRNLSKINLITCHLGGGGSITAIKKGKPIDTSMGLTPLEGLVMTMRSGDIDPGLIFYLNRECHLSIPEIDDLLNSQSGIKGLFGSGNFLKLLRAVKRGNKKARLAFDIFVYRSGKLSQYK